jgi:asparagine synthase (glutamine-hydrolysing)
MCGIAGFVDFNRTIDQVSLERSIHSLEHRGPDGTGIFYHPSSSAIVGLAHRRLSIIDLSEGGKQPMGYKHFTITLNGEIYNYQEIKKNLEQKGHQFKTHSDTEVVLHAYEEWGEDCLQHLKGMYAFVIYNDQKQTLFCVRDRGGAKPFFYYFKNGLFLFASELKAFHTYPEFEKKIDPDAVAAFMQYGNIPTPHCIFQNCYKLRPGHFLRFDFSTKSMEEVQYWNVYDAYNKPKMEMGFEEAKKQTEKVLQKAFDYRMVADVPVGIFLSGGYDSACVTSLLQKNNSAKLKTFTIGVPDIGLNEAPYAKKVAEHLGTDHTEFTCTQKEAIDLIQTLPHFYDEPFADSSAIPTMLVSRMAREKVTVALSADAGDEIFAGYNRYDYLIRYRKKISRIPGFGRKLLAKTMNAIPSQKIPVLRNKYNFHNRYEKLKGILRDPSSTQIMLSLSQQFTDDQIKKLLKLEFEKLGTAFLSKELKDVYYSPLSYMMAIDYQTYLVDDILQKVDRATMSVSLEGREPFLDHQVIEWAAQLPDDYKYHNGIKKYILKEIVHQYIPASMMERPKMGFAIPIGDWLVGELSGHLETYLNEALIRNQGIFNWEYVAQLKKDFLSGKKEYDTKIWYLLMFQMWYEKWMN